MTQEFHLSVTPVGQNDYLVRTEQVAPGVPLAEELVTWPVDDWLANAGNLMNDPLKSVLQGNAMVSDQPEVLASTENKISRNSVNLVALGQQFYNALFQGTLRDSWITAQGIAQNHQQVLRLRLGLKDTRLARLPWEVMHAGDRPLATGPYIAFSRYQSGISSVSRLPSTNRPNFPEDGVVRVLMVLASPPDQVSLDLLKQEAIRLQAELNRQLPRSVEGSNYLPEIELTLLDQPGREELTQALEQGRYHVLHYSGHSNLGANGGQIYLVSSRTGLTETLSGDDLAGLLVNNNIRMAVFNSCWGTYTATNTVKDTGERNLTDSLVKRGIQSVLAMSERIPDEVALTLTQLFYRNLSQGYPVDLCVSRVRQGLISAYGSHQMYWALPILYLQPECDGFLSPKISAATSVNSLDEYSSSSAASNTAIYSGVVNDTEIEMSLPIEEPILSHLVRDTSGLDWLGEETWGDLVDEIEYDDPSYAEDSAFVSDLFRQLDQQSIGNTEPDFHREMGQSLPDHRPIAPTPRQDFSSTVTPTTNETAPSLPQDLENFRLQAARDRICRQRWTIAGIVGAGAIATMITLSLWWQNRQSSPVADIPPIPTQSSPSINQQPIDLRQMSTAFVTETATEKLNQGDLDGGLAAVEELLNRNALEPAQIALNLIPSTAEKQASINFLKGRLVWQFIQTGDKKYSIDDARRYWETAVKTNPESFIYTNALGFAYYAEGNLNRANDAWFKALNLALKQQNTNASTPVSLNKAVPYDALTSYAGLALGLYKSARNVSADKQAQYLNEAIKLRQTVLKQDPINFQINKLSQNWLWTETSLQDWRSLLQQKTTRE